MDTAATAAEAADTGEIIATVAAVEVMAAKAVITETGEGTTSLLRIASRVLQAAAGIADRQDAMTILRTTLNEQ